MKKAFTMIELVFVIVILGILASFAMPKILTTIDESQATSQANTLKNVLSQFKSYYIINGDLIDHKSVGGWQNAAKAMSPQYLDSFNKNKSTNGRSEQWIKCVQLWPTGNQNASGMKKASRAYIHVAKSNDNSSFCQAFLKLSAVAKWIELGNNPGVSMADKPIFSDGSWQEDFNRPK